MPRIALASLALLAACAVPVAPPPAPVTDDRALFLDGTTWQVTAIDGRALPDGITASITRSGTSVAGQGGCNRFSGPVTLTPSALRFGDLAATRMACPPPQMEVDARLHTALASVDGVGGSPGGPLTLTAGGRAVVALTPALHRIE